MNISDGQTEIPEVQFGLRRTYTFAYPNLTQHSTANDLRKKNPLMTLSALYVSSEN